MNATRSSVNRFLKLALSIKGNGKCIHQTLTFSPLVYDPIEAKKLLNKLLDTLHKKIEMACIYVMERQANQSWHFHVLFYFFDTQKMPFFESRLVKDFGRYVYKKWNDLQLGVLHRSANQTKLVSQIFWPYFIKQISISGSSKKERDVFVWWGLRNKALIKANSQPIDRHSIKEMMEILGGNATESHEAQPREKVFTMTDVKRIEEYVNNKKLISWSAFKQKEMKQSKHVSNEDFLRYLNTSSILAKNGNSIQSRHRRISKSVRKH